MMREIATAHPHAADMRKERVRYLAQNWPTLHCNSMLECHRPQEASVMATGRFALLLSLLFCLQMHAQQAPVRIYIEATHGHKIVAGVDHPIAVPDYSGLHN